MPSPEGQSETHLTSASVDDFDASSHTTTLKSCLSIDDSTTGCVSVTSSESSHGSRETRLSTLTPESPLWQKLAHSFITSPTMRTFVLLSSSTVHFRNRSSAASSVLAPTQPSYE